MVMETIEDVACVELARVVETEVDKEMEEEKVWGRRPLTHLKTDGNSINFIKVNL